MNKKSLSRRYCVTFEKSHTNGCDYYLNLSSAFARAYRSFVPTSCRGSHRRILRKPSSVYVRVVGTTYFCGSNLGPSIVIERVYSDFSVHALGHVFCVRIPTNGGTSRYCVVSDFYFPFIDDTRYYKSPSYMSVDKALHQFRQCCKSIDTICSMSLIDLLESDKFTTFFP